MTWRDLRDPETGKLLGTVSTDGRFLRVKRRNTLDAIVDLRAPGGPRCLSRSEREKLNGSQSEDLWNL